MAVLKLSTNPESSSSTIDHPGLTMRRIHACRLETTAPVGRDADGRIEAGHPHLIAPRAGLGICDGYGDPDAKAHRVERVAPPSKVGLRGRDVNASVLVDAGEPPATEGHREPGVGVPNRHVHAGHGLAGVVVPLDRDAMRGGSKPLPDDCGHARRSDGLDLEQATTDHGAVRDDVRSHALGKPPSGFPRIDHGVDQQSTTDDPSDGSVQEAGLFAHDQYAII